LPARYEAHVPGRTRFGRPLQGDALYVRDLGNPAQAGLAGAYAPAKLARLCAIYAAFGLYDCAAEVAQVHRPRLASILSVDELLDRLCVEAQRGGTPLRYLDYMAAFEQDAPVFYTPEPARLDT
jgi:hypothetical protein